MVPRIFRVLEGPARFVLEWDARHHLLVEGPDPAPPLSTLLEWSRLTNADWADGVAEGRWPRLEAWSPETARLDTPLRAEEVGKILALGKNFRAHAEEFGEEVPVEPLFFNKLPETLTPHRAVVEVPGWYEGRVDHEAELAVVIGRTGKALSVGEAMEHVAGYCVANDLTARTLQKEDRARQFPWFRAKNLDHFLPLGPCFVPRGGLEAEQLRITAHVNGELRQNANTRDMVVDVPHALAYLSRHLTLRPGDLVLMGTPEGVGPLRDGDEVVCAVEGIGALHTRISRPASEATPEASSA